MEEVQATFQGLGIIEPLGGGGQGSVFLVELKDGRKGALKIYQSGNYVRIRAEREISCLEDIKSDVIVGLYGWGETNFDEVECLYVIYRFIEGNNLHDLIQAEGQLEEELVCRICTRIAAAIDELWNKRIVHRDINPKNIMVDKDNEVFLIDLGIAKFLDEETITSGGVMGTRGYMAPEHYAGRRNLTLKADIYSLGIVAYEALTGRHPFGRDQDRVGRVEPTLLRDIREVNLELEETIYKMLRVYPENRPSSGAAIIKKLEGIEN